MSRRSNQTTSGPPPSPRADAGTAPAQLLNRELSWLAFNARVLAEARDPGVPLAERLKFRRIVASNLDEFFMVRVAGLKQQLAGGVAETGADGMTPAEQLSAISKRVHTHGRRAVLELAGRHPARRWPPRPASRSCARPSSRPSRRRSLHARFARESGRC